MSLLNKLIGWLKAFFEADHDRPPHPWDDEEGEQIWRAEREAEKARQAAEK